MWQVGDIIKGLYEVRQIFTSGGMGDVYRVHHLLWNADLALKVPRVSQVNAIDRVAAFRHECELWTSLVPHPHVVTCHYFRLLDNFPCVFTEYVDGGSLLDWIQTRKLYRGTEEVVLARILDIAIQSAWGFEHAHSLGLVHQDVKPGNILVMEDGTAKVTDFGLASIPDVWVGKDGADPCKGLVSVNGMTPAFCSPEQSKRGRVSSKTDIYSWAVSVLEMFTGEVTWANGVAAKYALEEIRGKPIAPDIPQIPESVFSLLAECMDVEPERRPVDFRVIADLLQNGFRDIFGEPHDRMRPDNSLAELDALNNRALSMLDLGHSKKEAENLLIAVLKRDQQHPEANENLSLLKLGRDDTTFVLAKPKSGFNYYEEQRKFERLCIKAERAIKTGQSAEVLRYLQQAKDLESFRRHPRLKELIGCVGCE
jgi:serine/threonine protein kinase